MARKTRVVTTLGMSEFGGGSRFTDHVAFVGAKRTACGIRLGMSIPDPPALRKARAKGEVSICNRPGCL